MRFDTTASEARAELARYRDWVERHRPFVADRAPAGRRRALLTAFGPFGAHRKNASAEVLRSLAPEMSALPEGGSGIRLDVLAQARTAEVTLDLPRAGMIALRTLVLPVAWDLAAAFTLLEIDAFRPDMVVMTGIGRDAQPLVLELGGQNAAKAALDASGLLGPPEEGAALLPAEPAPMLPLLFDWSGALAAARGVHRHWIDRHPELETILPGVELGAPDRPSNRYLCNATAFTVTAAMRAPGGAVRILESTTAPGAGVDVHLRGDHREIPRVFVHMPAALDGSGLAAVTEIITRLVAAALAGGARPIPGRLELATYRPEPIDQSLSTPSISRSGPAKEPSTVT